MGPSNGLRVRRFRARYSLCSRVASEARHFSIFDSLFHNLAHFLISFHSRFIGSPLYTITPTVCKPNKMSQPRKSIRKKRQTQLSFTPLPSSSPATSQYSEQIQRRAASVPYDGTMSTPTKKCRIGYSTPAGSPFSQASSNGGSPFGSQQVRVVIPSPRKNSDQLPTPAASSQVEVNNEQGN